MRTHDSDCTGPEVLQVMAVATILLQYETCAQNHVIMGSDIRGSWARGINNLLSEKKTGFWANPYFSCAAKLRFCCVVLASAKYLVGSHKSPSTCGHRLAKKVHSH
jgi:hypothetical protein